MEEDYDLLCIFDLQPFVDPVRAADGRTYSRANIEQWFTSQLAQGRPIISPLTRAVMGKELVPDTQAAEAIEKRRMGLIDFKSLIPGARSIHDLGEVFATLDSVRDVLADFLEGWQPPQLVMVGKESSGKSSVLERLCMMPIFPRADNVCTRTPIHVRLRNSDVCEAATLEVFNTKTKVLEEGPHIIPTETGAIDVKTKMDEVLKKEGNHRLSMERIIIIKITSPYVPSIDLIDMPGLVTAPPEDRDRTRQLVTEHINAHGKYSLYLATVTADDAPNTSAAMEIVQAHNLQGKTVGVFTMVDEVMPGRKWGMFMERLLRPCEVNNGGVPIKPHGWVPVINAAVMEGESNMGKLTMQARDEEECLQAKMPELAAAGKAGCGALVGKLQTLFFDFLRQEWAPQTVRMLESACKAPELECAVLGMPAFHKAETEAQAREGAVAEARDLLTFRVQGLTNDCCERVLKSLTQEVQDVFEKECSYAGDSYEGVRILSCVWEAGKILGFLREQKEQVGGKFEEFVVKWADFWMGAVQEVLEDRLDPPDEEESQQTKKLRIEEPKFELDRFPTFIKAILTELEALLVSTQARLRETIASCLAIFYGEMSPWVRLSSNFGVSPPLVTVRFDALMLIENVLLAFVKEGDALISQRLCGKLDEVAALIKGSEAWIESCAAERVALLAKIGELKRAQGEILRAVFEVDSLDELDKAALGRAFEIRQVPEKDNNWQLSKRALKKQKAKEKGRVAR